MTNLATPFPTASPAFVTFEKVTKSYDGVVNVVDQLDLQVGSKEFLTLLGPSGSGKTTILTMLAGFETPSSGSIHMGGNAITNLPSHRREIGVVFQNYALFPHMTVGENIAFPLEMRKINKVTREKKVREVLGLVGLESHIDRKPSQLSGGQQQRVALARSIVFQPKLILMDEPLGALDNELRKRMQFEIRSLQQKLGVTVVFVTHDQSEALIMSDRVAVFNEGKIQQIDTPENIYTGPQSAFVASFIGETSWLEGQVIETVNERVKISCKNGVFVARNPQKLCVGEAAVFAVRPEDIRINEAWAIENHIEVTINAVTYLGDSLLLSCETVAAEKISVKIHKKTINHHFDVGSKQALNWKAEDTIAFRK